MSDPFLERLQREADARKRIAKLMALYEKHPDTPEGQSALRKAKELAEKNDYTLARLSPSGAAKAKLPTGAFATFGAAIKKTYPGRIEDSDLDKPKRRNLDEDRDDGDTY